MSDHCQQHKTQRQRRVNGFQLPWHYQQVIGWFVIIATALVNFFIIIHIQFEELKIISLIFYVMMYLAHCVSHITVTLLDPCEIELRKMGVYYVPEFDHNLHAHVIEHGRCHLCNIDTSSKKTKHCGLCNKCVKGFDHHCKWLNNCIGIRNYRLFLVTVVTALLLSLYTAGLCLTDVIFFYLHSDKLSKQAQEFVNCSVESKSIYCKNSIIFLLFIGMFFIITLTITCALIHLLLFHIYISALGMSTYEYIVSGDTSDTLKLQCFEYCKIKKSSLYKISRKKNKVATIENIGTEETVSSIIAPASQNTTTVLNSESSETKQVFLQRLSKVHPL